MNIKIDSSTVVSGLFTLAIVGGTIALAYFSSKKAEAERKANEEYKKSKSASLNLDDEIKRGSFNNDNFNVEEKAQAYSILLKYRDEFDRAYKIDDIDKTFKKFLDILTTFAGDNKDAAVALLKYETEVIRTHNASIARKQDIEAENAKYKIVADAVKTLGKDILKSKTISNRDLTEYTLRKIINGED